MLAVFSYPPIPIWEIGPFNFSLHGVFAAVGFAVGAIVATRVVGARHFDTHKYQSVLTWGLIGALLGARYLTTPAAIIDGTPILDALHPINGSFSIMGGFAGGIIGGGIRMRMLGMPVLATLDMSTFGLAIGTVIGRIGDLAIVEHLGRSTDVPWGYGVKPGYVLAPQHVDLQCSVEDAVDGLCGVYHHVAMYDMFGAAILLGVLYFAYRKLPLHYGQLIFLWTAWYGFQRFVLDGLRYGLSVQGDNADVIIESLGITWSQASGLVAGVGGLVLVWVMGRIQPRVSPEEDAKRGAMLPEGLPAAG